MQLANGWNGCHCSLQFLPAVKFPPFAADITVNHRGSSNNEQKTATIFPEKYFHQGASADDSSYVISSVFAVLYLARHSVDGGGNCGTCVGGSRDGDPFGLIESSRTRILAACNWISALSHRFSSLRPWMVLRPSAARCSLCAAIKYQNIYEKPALPIGQLPYLP